MADPLFKDLFNDTPGTEIADHVSDSLHTWSPQPGTTPDVPPAISDINTLRETSSGLEGVFQTSYAVSGGSYPHIPLKWKVKSLDAGYIGFIFDATQSGTKKWYLVSLHPDGHFYMHKNVDFGNASATEVGNAAISLSDEDEVEVYVDIDYPGGTSTRVRIYRYSDDTLLATFTDSSSPLAHTGRFGIYTNTSAGSNTTGIHLDYIGAVADMADWYVGPATDVAISGPSTATVGIPVTITLSLFPDAGTLDTPENITLSALHGTFDNDTVELSEDTRTVTVQYTATEAGSETISMSTDGSLDDTATLAITVSDPPESSGYKVGTISTTGKTTLGALMLNNALDVWNGSSFITPVSALHTYAVAIPLTEEGTTGLYKGDIPVLPAGRYDLIIYDGTTKTAESTVHEVTSGGLTTEQDTLLTEIHDATTSTGIVIGSNAITAATIATDAGAEIAAAVRTELATELGRIDAAITTRSDFDATADPVTVGDYATGQSPAEQVDISGLSTFDPTSDKVTPIDVDGLTHASIMEMLMAFATGKVSITDNGNGTSTWSFKKRNGTTEKVSVVVNDTTGARTSSTVS